MRVPFGHRKVRGVVVELSDGDEGKLEPILKVIFPSPVAPPPMDKVLDWIAERLNFSWLAEAPAASDLSVLSTIALAAIVSLLLFVGVFVALDRAAGIAIVEPGDGYEHVGCAELIEDVAPPAAARPDFAAPPAAILRTSSRRSTDRSADAAGIR